MTVRNLDAMCLGTLQTAPRAAVAWYLMASYLYYHRGVSILSDSFYDRIGQTMLATPHTFNHYHAHLITMDDLKAGSLYRLRADDYPTITRDTAEGLARQLGVL